MAKGSLYFKWYSIEFDMLKLLQIYNNSLSEGIKNHDSPNEVVHLYVV